MSFAQITISRRTFLTNSTLAAAATCLYPRHLLAQAPPDPVAAMRSAGATAKIAVQPLHRNVFVLTGSGGNIVVLPGPDGKLLIDSGFATSRPQIAEALSGLGPEPLKHLIDTHWHFDHTDGNEWMHAAGATIIAHENTKRRLSTPQVIAAFNANFPPAPAGAIPSTTFQAEYTLRTNNSTVIMTHFAPAHTDTDISVYIPEADVLHVGDTWFNGNYPFIDYSTGGHIDGMISATKFNLGRTTPATYIVPGHGPVGKKTQLIEYHIMLDDVRDKVATLKKQGKPVEAVIAAKPSAKYDEKWGTGFVTPDNFTRLVYQGV